MKDYGFSAKKCDVLVIGGGGSGALAGLEASRNDELKIIIASKGPMSQSGLTPTGNGGTAAATSTSVEERFIQMVTAGNYLNNQNVIWFMLNEIQNALEKLQRLGVSVSALGPAAVCVHGVETLSIIREELLRRPNVELLEHVLITRLVNEDGTIAGAIGLDLFKGELFYIEATAIIVATGGIAGELYPCTSNNPFGVPTDASGTGHVMAYWAGADLIDMEMMAFVPLPASEECQNLRYFPEFWKGPYLNRFGETIEPNTDVYLGGSYSYQFVQKLCRELEKSNGPIYVDQRKLEKPKPTRAIRVWDRRRRFIRSLGIDPGENRIELTLGSHFCMGGISVNEKTETSIPGLFAAGEVMGGVHGGLRLPGFSFTQWIVFGFEAGGQASYYAKENRQHMRFPTQELAQEQKKVYRFLDAKSDPAFLAILKTRLQQVMEDHVFVFRDSQGLNKAIHEIASIKESLARIVVPSFKRLNLEWLRAIEFSLMIEGAEIIAKSALFREESRGFHYRKDFENKDNKRWLKHTVARFEEGRLRIDSAPVALDRMRPEE
jgi:fumarate reductase (CoM/CoB) subunit A